MWSFKTVQYKALYNVTSHPFTILTIYHETMMAHMQIIMVEDASTMV